LFFIFSFLVLSFFDYDNAKRMSETVLKYFVAACVLGGACICFVVFAWVYAAVWKKGRLGPVRIVLLVGLLVYSALRIVYWSARYIHVGIPSLEWLVVVVLVERIEWLLLLLILLVLLYFWAAAVHEELDFSRRGECCFNTCLISIAVAGLAFCVAASAW